MLNLDGRPASSATNRTWATWLSLMDDSAVLPQKWCFLELSFVLSLKMSRKFVPHSFGLASSNPCWLLANANRIYVEW
jgi:hypothetical protein